MNGTFQPKADEPHGPPEAASRPLSLNRRGFVVSEGAGCILLAKRSFADAHGLPYGTALAGWSMTSDAHHFVSPYPETVTRCIAEAISDAGVSPDRIDAINAHATSTRIGDQVEVDALRSVFGGKLPPITANKSLTGHAMGASSAIEVVFALRGIEDQRLPPTINHTPDPELDIDCVAEGSRSVQQEYVLKNAFGFGGCNACIVFRKRE